MDYAIYFEKFCLGEERYFFKPVSVVRGAHFKEDKEFLTETGLICEDISDGIYNADYYFGFGTDEQGLEERYGKRNLENLLELYFSELSHEVYFSFANKDERLCTIAIPFSSLEDVFDTNINGEEQKIESLNNIKEEPTQENPVQEKLVQEDSIQVDKKGQEERQVEQSGSLVITLPNLKAIRNLTNIEDIYKVLDGLMNRFYHTDGKTIILKEGELNVSNDIKPTSRLKINKENMGHFTLSSLRHEVLKTIVGQDEAVFALTKALVINKTSHNARNKSHFFITGPTGTGKTEMVHTICTLLDLPYFEADATAYTKEGYVGKSVYSMLSGLLNAANGDLEKAQHGILVIDEIDKKLFGRSDDVGGVSVLQSLYKILDRQVVELDISEYANKKTIYFDTKHLTVIVMGAFEDLYQKKLKLNKSPIGFGKASKLEEIPLTLTREDLIEGGVPPEFLGRIGEMASTHAFSEKEMLHLLTKSNISALKIQQDYFMDVFDVELKTTYGYREAVIKKALQERTNARSIGPIVKETLSCAIEDFLDGKRGKVLKLTKETVRNPRKYEVE